MPGKKRKDQHDPNQAAMAMNPAYAGAYGAPPVNIYLSGTHNAFSMFLDDDSDIYISRKTIMLLC